MIYGDLPTAKLSAGYISYNEYLEETGRKLNSRLNVKSKNKKVNVGYKIYDSWEELEAELGKKLKKEAHVNQDYKFDKIIKGKTIDEKLWNENKKYKGFYISNIRGSRKKITDGKKINNPILFKRQILNELKEGINSKTTSRVNLFYEDDETNPNNYKFIHRYFVSESNCVTTDNTTIYNGI